MRKGSVRRTLVKGDRVVLDTEKVGTIMFKGTTGFAKGEWYGLELDTPDGKHDGLVKKDMKRYFKCKKKHGVFVQRKKIVALAPKKLRASQASSPVSKRTSARASGRGSGRNLVDEKKSELPPLGRRASHKITDEDGNLLRRKLIKGDRVELSSGKSGKIMYIGSTQFASGEWIGLELDEKEGKHNGFVGIKRYFTCKAGHGTFVRREKITKCLKKERITTQRVTTTTKLEEDCIVGVVMNDSEIAVGKIRWQGNPRNIFGRINYGVELRDGGGDNDGMIKGRRYFKTPPNCCVFVPRSRIDWMFYGHEWQQKGRYPELPL